MTEDVKQASESEDQDDDKRGASLPNDGSYVARERLNDLRDNLQAEIRSLKGDNDQLRGQVSTLQKPSTPEREYSRHELGQMVESGAMTQDEAGRVLDTQQESRTQRTVDVAVNKAVSTATQGQGLKAEFDRYMAAVPEAGEAGTEARGKLQREFDYLISLGRPGGVETEVMALRAAFGDVGLIQTGKPVKETHQETGGGEPDDPGPTSDTWPKDMPAKYRDYYRGQIDKGLLPDMAAAKKQWNYKPKHGPKAA